jgi:hypothetical protein
VLNAVTDCSQLCCCGKEKYDGTPAINDYGVNSALNVSSQLQAAAASPPGKQPLYQLNMKSVFLDFIHLMNITIYVPIRMQIAPKPCYKNCPQHTFLKDLEYLFFPKIPLTAL